MSLFKSNKPKISKRLETVLNQLESVTIFDKDRIPAQGEHTDQCVVENEGAEKDFPAHKD